MLCQSVAWEQVLDASAKANIQHAATKVTNMLYLPLGVRLFRLPRQLGKSGFMPKAALEFVMH